MSIEWVSHKGKKILVIDYSGLEIADQLEQIKKAVNILVKSGNKDNLSLTDVSKTNLTQEFAEMAKIMGKQSALVTKKAAIVGVTGIRKIILNTVNSISGNSRKPFDTVEEAKDWLVE